MVDHIAEKCLATPAASIIVITHFPSPYQVELFDEIERQAPGRLEVIYLKSRVSHRQWQTCALLHHARFLNGDGSSLAEVKAVCAIAGMVIFNFYDDADALRLINLRAKLGLPWCFWGERPGYLSPFFGRLRRIWVLRALHRCRAPIWGIGRKAADTYREEFGAYRQYVNLPYFSHLERFSEVARSKQGQALAGRPRVVLYSGSLIRRKGVDLLARSFARVAAEVPQARLLVMGAGRLERSMRRSLSGCLDRVEFTGFRDWDTLPAVYARADVLCAPSCHDGWGLIVPEALAAGLPVISTTATGAAVDFVETGTNGWLIPPRDEDALLTSMRNALTLPATQLAAMSAAAAAAVQNHRIDAGARRFIAAADQAVREW